VRYVNKVGQYVKTDLFDEKTSASKSICYFMSVKFKMIFFCFLKWCLGKTLVSLLSKH